MKYQYLIKASVVPVKNPAIIFVDNLELFGNITILLVVYFMSPTLSVSVLVAININLHTTLNRIWWLFHMFHDVSSNAAEWSALEQYLISYVPENYHYKTDLAEYTIDAKITKKHDEDRDSVEASNKEKIADIEYIWKYKRAPINAMSLQGFEHCGGGLLFFWKS